MVLNALKQKAHAVQGHAKILIDAALREGALSSHGQVLPNASALHALGDEILKLCDSADAEQKDTPRPAAAAPAPAAPARTVDSDPKDRTETAPKP